MGIILIATLALIANSPQAPSVPAQAHQDALAQFKSGMVALESERYDEAEAAFKKAVNLEPNYEGAYYGLGQTYMRKHLFEDAVQAYLHSREAFRQNAAAEAAGDVAAEQRLRDQIQALKDTERALQRTSQASTPLNVNSAIERIRGQITLLESRRNRRPDAPPPVPAGLSMALGSAYFRLARHEDAEREYKAAIAADPAFGEAHSNLAVLYMVTERYDQAEAEVKAAEKAGFKVNPNLKADIKKKRGG
jgi:Flp pilus assembly protein TadD